MKNHHHHQHSSNRRGAGGPKRPIIQFEILELQDKVHGHILDFNCYHDSDLPFLNNTRRNSALMKQNIIHGELDDDCQTDDEQKEDAKRMLLREVSSAISHYL
jgi:hypothetical protein